MVQRDVVMKILKRDVTAFGEFEYDFSLILGIKRFARKSKFKDRIEFIEAQSRAREPIDLEMELRKAVLDHYLYKI